MLAERRELVMQREERDPRDASVMPRTEDTHPETGSSKGFPEEMEDTGIDYREPSRRANFLQIGM